MQIPVQRRPTLILIIVLAVLLGIMAVHPRTESGPNQTRLLERAFMAAFSWIPRGVNAVGQSLADAYYGYVDLRGIVAENRTLRDRVERLTEENINLRNVAGDLSRMRATLGYALTSELPTSLSGIVMLDTAGPFKSMVLDRGEESGVEINDAVVNPEGLIGRVILTTPELSKVQLVIDAKSAVGVRIERTHRQGVLKGDGAGGLDLTRVPALADVVPGDRIVTAGIDGVYPPGIPVATVTEVSEGSDLFTKIKCVPIVTFSALDTALIINTTKLPREVEEYQP